MKVLGIIRSVAMVSALLMSSTGFANRCIWNATLNQSNCCSESEQALWDTVWKRPICVESTTGDSCAWDQITKRARCCEAGEHAVWNPLLNTIECFAPEVP